MTVKQIVFLMPYELLKKIVFSEEVRLEIVSRQKSLYPLVSFELNEENLEVLEAFKNECVDGPIISEK